MTECMPSSNLHLTPEDRTVLAVFESQKGCEEALHNLQAMTDPLQPSFVPTVASSFDFAPCSSKSRPTLLNAYIQFAQSVARHPSDSVFVTHLLIYSFSILPSAWLLWHNYTTTHAVIHWIYTLWSAGPFTLLMHNHLHQNGILAKPYSFLDTAFPYILGPFMGHTADSYRHHHRYMHHVEGNGPDDLSSTIRYQRDSFGHFLLYFFNFFFTTPINLSLYFWRHKRYQMAVRSLLQEILSVLFIVWMYALKAKPALVLFIVPVIQMRFFMMLGNWGQHALVDESAPDSNLRSSITLIEANSNRQCFNDGYHTSHHLNPLRHWRSHPESILFEKERYTREDALIFKDIDFLFISIRLFLKDYDCLARHLVPIGRQCQMSHKERIDMLRRKTKRFTEAEIETKFRKRGQQS